MSDYYSKEKKRVEELLTKFPCLKGLHEACMGQRMWFLNAFYPWFPERYTAKNHLVIAGDGIPMLRLVAIGVPSSPTTFKIANIQEKSEEKPPKRLSKRDIAHYFGRRGVSPCLRRFLRSAMGLSPRSKLVGLRIGIGQLEKAMTDYVRAGSPL